tara:strand:+ start:3451 stop:4476 length:1026 start_codon:yes stop_codon:yes gene_type:complete
MFSFIKNKFREKKPFYFENKVNILESDIILGFNPYMSREELLLKKCNIKYNVDYFKLNDYFIGLQNKNKYEDYAIEKFMNETKLEVKKGNHLTHFLHCDIYGKCSLIGSDFIVEIFYSSIGPIQELSKDTMLKSHYCIIQFLASLYMKKYCYYVIADATTNKIKYIKLDSDFNFVNKNIKGLVEFNNEVLENKKDKTKLKNSIFYKENKQKGFIDSDSESLTDSPEKLFKENTIEEQEDGKFILDKITPKKDIDLLFEPVIDYPDLTIVSNLIIEATINDMIEDIVNTIKFDTEVEETQYEEKHEEKEELIDYTSNFYYKGIYRIYTTITISFIIYMFVYY